MPSAKRQRRWERQRSLFEKRTSALGTARVAAFFATIGTALAAGPLQWFPVASALAFVVCLSAFVILVIFHGRVRDALATNAFRRRLEADLEARRTLAWKDIPSRPIPEASEPTALDLGIVGGERSLFRLLDVTATTGGARKLRALLASGSPSREEIERRRARVAKLERLRVARRRYLSVATTLREQVATEAILERASHSFATSNAKRLLPWLVLLHVVFFASLLCGYGGVPGPWRWIVPGVFFVLAFFYRAVRKRLPLGDAYRFAEELTASVQGARRLLPEAQRLFRSLDEDSSEKTLQAALERLERATGSLAVRQNYMAHMALNALFPWDAYWTVRLEEARAGLSSLLPAWFARLAELEAFLALAEFGAARPSWTAPQLTDAGSPLVEAKDLAHPLLAEAGRVGNDVTLGPPGARCLLLSGSNMAGKSTLLRSIGTNVCLAMAGARVCAKEFRFRPVRLVTSIHLVDSLEHGLSLFLAEVRKLKNVLDVAQTASPTQPVLYLVDELFRGTNHRERVAAARAFLEALAATTAGGFVTSHDSELTALEGNVEGIANWHLEERWEGETPLFRYRLLRGPATGTNALRIVAAAGLPVPKGN